MQFYEFVFVPSILFMVIVAPMWISMHYRSKNKANQGLSAEDREIMEDMINTIDKLGDRIETLENILDQDHQNWRRHNAEAGAE